MNPSWSQLPCAGTSFSWVAITPRRSPEKKLDTAGSQGFQFPSGSLHLRRISALPSQPGTQRAHCSCLCTATQGISVALAWRCLPHRPLGKDRDAMGELCPSGGQPAAQQDHTGKESRVLKMGFPEGRVRSFPAPHTAAPSIPTKGGNKGSRDGGKPWRNAPVLLPREAEHGKTDQHVRFSPHWDSSCGGREGFFLTGIPAAEEGNQPETAWP